MDISTTEIPELDIAEIDEAGLIDALARASQNGKGGWIVTANADITRQCRQNRELLRIVKNADLIVADGMPLIWASRILGRPLPGRVCGSDLVWSIGERAARDTLSIFLLGGGEPETANRAAARLQARFPGLEISGTHYPPFGFESNPEEMAKIRAALDEARPDVVYVALGFPKAEKLIYQLKADYPQAWWIGVGISLSFIAGEVARAPGWMQATGLEWLHRLLQEPGRLVKRYLWHDIPFVVWLLGWATRERFRRARVE